MLQRTCAVKGAIESVEMTSDKMATNVFVFGRWHNHLSHQRAWLWLMHGAFFKGAVYQRSPSRASEFSGNMARWDCRDRCSMLKDTHKEAFTSRFQAYGAE